LEASRSVSDIYDLLARETITIFSRIVKEKRQMNSQVLSEMYAEDEAISRLVSEMTATQAAADNASAEKAASDTCDESDELKELARKKDLEMDELNSEHRKKTEILFKVIRTLSILSKSEKNHVVNGLIEKLNQHIKSSEAFDKDLIEQTLGELRNEVLKSDGTDKPENGKKRSFLGELFKTGKTIQSDASASETNIKDLLIAIVLRLQMEKSDFDQRVRSCADGIRKNDLEDLQKLQAGICELIGGYKERLNEEKTSLYELIQEIATKLVDTEKELLQVLSESQTLAGKSNSDFHESFSREIISIEEGLRQGNTVEDIRKLVFERLGNIRTSLQKKREIDKKQFEEVQVHIEHFRTELSSQEQEIRKIQDRTDLDALTGIYNKSAFQHRLKEQFKEYSEIKNSASIIIFDLDNFSRINEKYTFDNGDRILQTIAKVVTELKRNEFFFARNRGGEFVLLLNVFIDEAETFAENLRKTILSIDFYHKEEKVPVSISVGVADFSGTKNPVQILQKAHGALQEAKKRGKNQVRVKK